MLRDTLKPRLVLRQGYGFQVAELELVNQSPFRVAYSDVSYTSTQTGRVFNSLRDRTSQVTMMHVRRTNMQCLDCLCEQNWKTPVTLDAGERLRLARAGLGMAEADSYHAVIATPSPVWQVSASSMKFYCSRPSRPNKNLMSL